MNRKLSALLASALLAGGLMLPACGSSPAETSDEPAKTEAVEVVKEDPAKKFVGDWKLAAAETNGVKLVGDIASVMGAEATMEFSFKDDGKGTFSFNGESVDVTWELKDDDNITIEIEQAASDEDQGEEESEPTIITATYKDDELSVDMEEYGGTMVFTTTGKSKQYAEIVADDATDITSKDALVGAWKLTGMNLMGISVYGDSESLGSFAGQSFDANITFEADGTGKLADTDITWEIGDNGATLSIHESTASIKQLDSQLLIDLTGATGMNLALLYTK